MIYLHIDVDNLWIYEKEFGVKILSNKEYIYKSSLPLLLKFLDKSGSKATFMIIGKDLELPACRSFCKKAISKGHEIANHSWSHPIFFGKMSFEEKKKEILKAHNAITKTCKIEPVGFRGPGYYQDREIITILEELNYKYDTSVLPGYAEILMSVYANLQKGENRNKTFGRLSYIIKRQKPHTLKNDLIEFPISILPILRLPIHTTFAYFFGEIYQKLILRHVSKKRNYLLYLLHAIDFVDIEIQKTNNPVLPLRTKFEERMKFIEKIIDSMVLANGGPLKTTRNNL